MPKETPIDPAAATEMLDASYPVSDPPEENLHDDNPLYPDDQIDRIELHHRQERDRIIAMDKIVAGSPDFEQRASERRAAVWAHDKTLHAVGDVPLDGFIPPPADHEAAPKAATGFAVQSIRRRNKNRV